MTAAPEFEWRLAKDAIDRFIVHVNDPEVSWAWEVARRCVTVYATMTPGMPSLDAAKAYMWEKFTVAALDGDESYAGLYGLADELWTRIPESKLDAFETAILKGRARADGRPPPQRRAPATDQRRRERGGLRLVVDNTRNDEGDA